MYLAGLTVCVNYADFLVETIPFNKSVFDYWIVVTTPEDLETQKVCEAWGVHCVTTDAFGAVGFNKAAGINVGLQHLQRLIPSYAWIAHVDADIALPQHTQQILRHLNLDRSMIYGIDRHNIRGAKHWRKHLLRPKVQHEANAYLHAEAYKVATRFVTSNLEGYVPIGFFQLWNPQGSGIDRYPLAYASADRTDTLFATQWPRAKRGFIPEIIGYHLESEDAPQGANWGGRRTIPFDCRPRWYRPFFWFWWKRHRKHKHHHRHHGYLTDDVD